MACNGGGQSGPTYDDRKLIAAMCGVLTAVDNSKHLSDLLDHVDWEEAGVTRKWLERWWEDHQADDRKRKAKEQEKENKQRKKKAALAKLTQEEQKLLKEDRYG